MVTLSVNPDGVGVTTAVWKAFEAHDISLSCVRCVVTDKASYLVKLFSLIKSSLHPSAIHIFCSAHRMQVVGQVLEDMVSLAPAAAFTKSFCSCVNGEVNINRRCL